jgi:hypothetical protein
MLLVEITIQTIQFSKEENDLMGYLLSTAITHTHLYFSPLLSHKNSFTTPAGLITVFTT